MTLAFLGMFVVGAPVWWKSTEIYRAELPYEDITRLYQERGFSQPFPIELHLFLWPSQFSGQEELFGQRIAVAQRRDALGDAREEFRLRTHSSYTPLPSNSSCEEVDRWLEGQERRNGVYSFVGLQQGNREDTQFTICPSGTVLMRQRGEGGSEQSWIESAAEIGARMLVSSPSTEDKVHPTVICFKGMSEMS